jgi:hypothetical protein
MEPVCPFPSECLARLPSRMTASRYRFRDPPRGRFAGVARPPWRLADPIRNRIVAAGRARRRQKTCGCRCTTLPAPLDATHRVAVDQLGEPVDGGTKISVHVDIPESEAARLDMQRDIIASALHELGTLAAASAV